MKKFRKPTLLLCLCILCLPLHTYAEEGFSWDVKSEEADNSFDETDGSDSEDTDETDEDKTDEDETDEKDAADGDSKSSGRKYPSKVLYTRMEMKALIEDAYDDLRDAYEIDDAFKRTKKIDSIDSYILNFSEDLLGDKKIAFFGDSITAGNGGTQTPDGSGLNYTDFIAHYTSAEIVNLGIGGTSFSTSGGKNALVERYEDIPDDSDMIVIFGGFNDLFAGSSHFGSLEAADEGTYCGDVEKTFAAISENHPDASVYVVITYPNKMEQYKEHTGESWQEYADIQLSLAEKYDFHTINLYKEGFLDSNDSEVRNAFFKDDIHPDDLGSEVLGRHILVHLMKRYQ